MNFRTISSVFFLSLLTQQSAAQSLVEKAAAMGLFYCNPNATTQPKNQFCCPPISTLTKSSTDNTWSATSRWVSHDISFVNTIAFFLGAQWQGANVGQVTCIYHGQDENSFPVLLTFNTLTYEPTVPKWGNNQGGYRNCVSNNTAGCPFQLRLAPANNSVEQEAESIKPDDSKSNGNSQ